VHLLTASGDGDLALRGDLWLKFVRGFDSTKHGTKCLVGEYCVNLSANSYLKTGQRELAGPKLPYDFMVFFSGRSLDDPNSVCVGMEEDPMADAAIHTPNGDWLFRITRAKKIDLGRGGSDAIFAADEQIRCPLFRLGIAKYGPTGTKQRRTKKQPSLF